MVRHLLFLCLFFALSAESKILIKTVAQVKNHVITSREISIHKELSARLGEGFKSFDAQGDTEKVVREWLLFNEASTFYNSKVDLEESRQLLGKALATLKNNATLQSLAVTESELREKIKRRLEANRLYEFKKKASVLPVSQADIETEYNQNRIRYGNLNFKEVEERIRQNKIEENLKKRLDQWFRVLEKKYKVQRFAQAGDD